MPMTITMGKICSPEHWKLSECENGDYCKQKL
jgi:hypothetical protein